jgi:glycosyltransferase involved in cell wall biosynthesis
MPWGLSSQDAVPSLSIVILTRNEARNIVDCVRSARFADEVVVLDSASSDGTPDLARAEGAKVSVSADWPGFGPQKNRVLAQATGEWVFSLDADERITPALRDAILAAIASPGGKVAFEVDRTSSYCGQVIRHSGWSPDWVLRLFRRDSARFSDDLVHERVVAQGPTGRLAGALLHDSMPNLESVVDKINRYSTAGAQMLVDRGRRATLGQALSHGAWAFFRTYVLRRGFLDGSLGLALAISNAEGTYYRYLKAWLAQRNANAPSQS